MYQQFIHQSRYARFLDEELRRETWEETIGRYFEFFGKYLKDKFNYEHQHFHLRGYTESLHVMPSMRCIMTAGPALEKENIAGYNCSYVPIDSISSLSETLYILMCGTGVGFSVERQVVKSLPEVPKIISHSLREEIVVGDSKQGWAEAYDELLRCLFKGTIPRFNFSLVRPAGARLKTFGGRASGPEPLNDLFQFTIAKFMDARGRRLTSLELHDIATKIGSVVVVGGVRRSAMISLSNLSDQRMQKAKHGSWWETEPQRSLANNSVAYTERPEMVVFMGEWLSLYESKSGERGIFNREAAISQARRIGRDSDFEWGTNPCGEIQLRPFQFCNLSEVIIRPHDDLNSLREKVRAATILGTWQSALTNFRFLRPEWKKNTEEEHLLGVSLTGICDHPVMGTISRQSEDWNRHLNQLCKEVNEEESRRIGIKPSTARTCIKPSGTVSQLVDASPGIHTRWSEYYVRTVRGDVKDPLSQFLKDSGVPCEPCVVSPQSVHVFSFPMKSPKEAKCRNDMTALQQLDLWLHYRRHWTDHNPSATIYVNDSEWMAVGAWVWENFDEIGGLTFLPSTNHTYRQAPYQDITAEEYEKLNAAMPQSLDWAKLQEYEKGEDYTTGTQELACSAGVCEIVDIGKGGPG